MYTKCKIKVSAHEDGLVKKAYLRVPKDDITLHIINDGGFLRYDLDWKGFSVSLWTPLENVGTAGLNAEEVAMLLRKPYKAIYKVLGDTEAFLADALQSLKGLEESGELKYSKFVSKIYPNDDGTIHKAVFGISHSPFGATMFYSHFDDEVSIYLTWDTFWADVKAPRYPYFDTLVKEKTLSDLLTSFYATFTVLLSDLIKVIRDYRARAGQDVDSVICSTG